jgi:DNA-binding Xre family transcriptional regulator
MLKELVEARLKDQRLSVRQAAQELGISHTTIHRVLAGEAIDLDTVIKLCKWLGVRPSDILDVDAADETTSAAATIALVIAQEPRLGALLTDLSKDLKAGNVSPEDVKDIVAYALYRLENGKSKPKQGSISAGSSVPSQGR